jgi:hypothetical protein
MNNPSPERIESFKQAVIKAANNPLFIHHPWFVKYHLDIVDQIATELLAFYPQANPELVKVLVWIHDYGKTLDFDNQYELTLTKGKEKLLELDFDPQFVDTVIDYMAILDKKLELDIRDAPLEVQIVSTADGCSHFVGPFMAVWWQENSTKPFEELMEDNRKKAEKDWNRKIVLPEARKAFEKHYALALEQSGALPNAFLS